MHAKSPRIPSYRKHKASGQAVVTIRGRDVYLGRHGTAASRREYDRVIAEWRASGHRRPKPVQAYTVTDLIAAYWQHACEYYRRPDGTPTPELACLKTPLRALRRLYGDTPAAEFGPLALKAVRQTLIDAGQSRTTVNKNVARLKRAFGWAVGEELVPASVSHALREVPGLKRGRSAARETEPVRPVADEAVEAVRPFLRPQLWAMVELQRLTGMRPGEVCSMRARDIDTTGELWEYRPAHHKNSFRGHDRVVVIGPRARAILEPFLSRDLDAYLFQPAECEAARSAARRRARKTPLWPSHRRPARTRANLRERYSTTAYARAIRRACDRAFPPPPDLSKDKVKAWRRAHRWSPNQLRHTAATLIRRRYGLEAAQSVLGHAHASVTEVYAESNRQLAREVAARVG